MLSHIRGAKPGIESVIYSIKRIDVNESVIVEKKNQSIKRQGHRADGQGKRAEDVGDVETMTRK